ncbi:hypothetical protein SEA_SOOS_33 [Gordonia phage Soos]|nr:hypothetical protein SEA_SOOS_33 [Gordonia phage Soos]
MPGYTGDEVLLFALDLARALCGEPEDGDSPDSYYDDVRETVAVIGESYRTDSMGLSTIHYWPNVTMQEEP